MVLLSVVFTLSACQTSGGSTVYNSVDLEGNALKQDEAMLINARMYSPYATCRHEHCTQQNRRWLIVEMKFNDLNFAYRVGYQSPGGRKPRSTEKFDLYFGYRFNRQYWQYELRGIDFSRARKVVSNGGRTYWLTDWFWDATAYQHLQLANNKYSPHMTADSIQRNQALIKLLKNRTKGPDRAVSWDVALVGGENLWSSKFSELYEKRRLRGSDALAALENPKQVYEDKILPIDNAYTDYRAKRKNAARDNQVYSRFIRKNFVPLTIKGGVRSQKCPILPGMANIGHNPPNEFYGLADQAVQRGQCLDKVLNSYSLDPLIDTYAELQKEEERLFSNTVGEERFSIEAAVKEIDWAVNELKLAADQATRLYDAGDQTARIWAKKRKAQQQEAAVMRSLYAGLQNLNSQMQANNARRQQEFKRQLRRIHKQKAIASGKYKRNQQAALNKLNSASTGNTTTSSGSSSSGSNTATASLAPAIYLMSEAKVASCSADQWSQQRGASCEVVENGQFVTLARQCLDKGKKIEGYRRGRAYSIWRFAGLTTAEASKLMSAKQQSAYEFTADSPAAVKKVYFANRTDHLRIFWSQEAAKAGAGRYCPGAQVDWLD